MNPAVNYKEKHGGSFNIHGVLGGKIHVSRTVSPPILGSLKTNLVLEKYKGLVYKTGISIILAGTPNNPL